MCYNISNMTDIQPNNTVTPPPGSPYFNNSIFWIEIEKIKPNPYQPRREFDPVALKDLSESIRMYGLLQPLVVTRKEIVKEDGGLAVEYELISGERRLRASKLAQLTAVPAIIRAQEEDARVKLELAIIENLQREDLNAVDRAYAFERLANEFGFKHAQIAEKVGKSREYVTNSIRLLMLPKHMLTALSEGKITEGHTRPILMLASRPEEQETLFKEIVFKKITVREAESIARGIAVERVRRKDKPADPEMDDIQTRLNEALGTRVQIERKEKGGKLVIDFFSNDDLHHLLDLVSRNGAVGVGQANVNVNANPSAIAHESSESLVAPGIIADEIHSSGPAGSAPAADAMEQLINATGVELATGHSPADELTSAVAPFTTEQPASPAELNPQEKLAASEQVADPLPHPMKTEGGDDDIYSIKNFSI